MRTCLCDELSSRNFKFCKGYNSDSKSTLHDVKKISCRDLFSQGCDSFFMNHYFFDLKALIHSLIKYLPWYYHTNLSRGPNIGTGER